MAVYSVLPQTLDLTFVRGDEFGILVDASIDLTSYSFATSVYKATGIVNGVATGTSEVLQFTLTVVSLVDGKINLSLQETQTMALLATDKMRWYLRWVAPGVITRTVISGSLTVQDP